MKKTFGKTFGERVVGLALSIPLGRVTTYGALARAAGGGRMASQSITSILGRAYQKGETKIPFHRIVYSDGRVWLGDYASERLALYKKEKIQIDERGKIQNFEEKLYEFL